METATTTFQAVARELAGAFEIATRPDGSEFYRLRSDAPAWIGAGEIAHGVHVAVDGRDPRLPCDFIYRLAALAADFLAEYADADAARDDIGEWASARVDYSIPRLFEWAASHALNRCLADEAGENIPARHESFESYAVDVLQAAQALAAERVADFLASAVETEAASRG